MGIYILSGKKLGLHAYLFVVFLNGGFDILLHECTGRCDVEVNVIDAIRFIIVIGQHGDAEHFLLECILETALILTATSHQ